jgi:signal transduction histidine kinase
VIHGPHGPDELTEVPLMAAVFLAMVWHAERRQAALESVPHAAAREHEFVRAASHQLRTPIAVARGTASLIRSEPAADTVEEDLDDLIEELDRLSRITDDLLLLAATEQHDSLLRADVDFEDLVVAAGRRWSRVENRLWEIAPCDGVLVDSDRTRLDSALDAVIENAVTATETADAISLVARAEGDVAVIEVVDTGVGIPDSALPHVFERFWRTPYGTEDRRGTGLGLAIAETIVDAHGGDIAVSSSLGRGTRITIRLPRLRKADTNPHEDLAVLIGLGRGR